jgi:glycosyltransferase involved in cell wall biosynthesis
VPAAPRVVIAAPLYNGAAHLAQALDSLVAQTFPNLAVLLVDDGSTDDTLAIAHRYAARDPRVHVEVNESRLGMLHNTRKALWRARELFPTAEFWALGSDHDVWDPRFLEVLVGLLDAHPAAVLAYPDPDRIDALGAVYAGAKRPKGVSTLGIEDRLRRLDVSFRDMAAGSMIYGLFRLAALEHVTFYRPVLLPDRLFLSELALRGPFVHAPEVLWQRRFRGLADLERQRRAFFLGDVPAYARVPWWLQHTGAIALAYGLRGEGRDVGLRRLDGVALAARYLRLALALRARRRWARAKRWARSKLGPTRVARRLLGSSGPSAGAATRAHLDRLESARSTRWLAARVLRPGFERVAARFNGAPGTATTARPPIAATLQAPPEAAEAEAP